MKVSRILVFNVNWLGDVIFSIPVFKALKLFYPESKIYCAAVPGVKDLLSHVPQIDEVMIFDEKGQHFSPWGKAGFVRQMRQENLDLAFLLHRSWTRAFLTALAGAKERVGFDTKNRAVCLTYPVPVPRASLHRSDYYAYLLEAYGLPVYDRVCDLAVPQRFSWAVEALLREDGIEPEDRLVVLHTGGNWDLKRWSAACFAPLINELMYKCRVKVILSGMPGDKTRIDQLISLTRHRPLNWAGKVNVSQLLALLKRAQLVISGDSGPLHLASAVGAAVIGLFGPTRPEVTGPRGAGEVFVIQKDVGCNRQPCYYLNCPDNLCMKTILWEDVFQVAQKILR